MTLESLYHSGESIKVPGTGPLFWMVTPSCYLGTLWEAGNSLCLCAGGCATQEVEPHIEKMSHLLTLLG